MCDAYLALNPSDALALGVGNGDLISIASAEGGCALPLYIRKETPSGVALVYAGSSALGARINPHDLPRYSDLTVADIQQDSGQVLLGLSSLVVNDSLAGVH